MTRSLSVLLVLAMASGVFAGVASLDPDLPTLSFAADGDEKATVTDGTLQTFDGETIAFTVFRPAGVSAGAPVPLVLHSHGWGGSRATEIGGIVEDLLDAGYGVLSFDARGHGDSTGYATIHHKDFEVKDTLALIDWAYDNLAWAEKEGAAADKDLVLGAVGGSYGGGYQLMAASYDDRLDAIAPQMTWNDLRYSLAPGGVVKSTWVDALYGFGLQGVNMHPDIHEWFATATATNQLPAAALVHLKESSPVPENIGAATLLVQGLPDALFNWNEAVRNYQGILAGGNTNVAVVGYLGGHVLPFPLQPVGAMGPARGGEPCGAYSDLALAWFDHHLRGNASAAVPTGVTYALEEGGCVAAPSDDPAAVVDVAFPALPAPNSAGTILVPLDVPAGTIAGRARLQATFTGATETIFSAGLVVLNGDGRIHVVDDQAAFLRVTPALGSVQTAIDLDMTGVATLLGADDTLLLRIDGLHEWAPTGAARAPGGGLFLDVVVGLPYL